MSVDENKVLLTDSFTSGSRASWASSTSSPRLISVIYPLLGKPARGAAAFKQLLAHFHAACPDVEISVQEQIAEGDKVVTRWSVCGTHRGELLGVPPTGRPLSWTGITIHRLVGGRVMEERREEDALGLIRQTGVMHDPILVSDAAFS